MNSIIGVLDKKFINPYIMVFASILEHTKEFIEFHLICNDLTTEDTIGMTEKLLKINNKFHITYVQLPSNYRKELFEDFKKITTHCTNNTLMKVYIPEYCEKKGIEKILYVDGDFIFAHDVSELLKVDVSDNILGAVSFPWYVGSFEYPMKLKLPESTIFFNAGLMLLNINKLKGYLETFRKFVKEFYDVINGDQICWNGIVKGDVKKIDISWNVPYKAKCFKRKDTKTNREVDFPDYSNIKGAHFCAKEKPWIDGFYADAGDPVMAYYNNLWVKVFGKPLELSEPGDFQRGSLIEMHRKSSIPKKITCK